MKYIRDAYGVPAKRGMKILYTIATGGQIRGTITGSRGAHLRVKLELDEYPKSLLFHPTWNITYPDKEGNLK